MPFGAECEYPDFDACVLANGDKQDPEAYCAELMRATEGRCAQRQLMVAKQTRATLRMAAARARMQARLARRFAAGLRGVFKRQARQARREFLDEQRSVGQRPTDTQKSRDPNRIIPESDVAILEQLILRYSQPMWDFSSGLAAEAVSVDPSTVINQAARARILRRATTINDTTREAVARVIDQGIADRLTDSQIADRLEGVVEQTYAGRADTIARTELAIVDQDAAHDRYREAGVGQVEIFDGPNCGWTFHDDPDKANGSIRTLNEAEDYPIAHPNCVRASAPVIDDE